MRIPIDPIPLVLGIYAHVNGALTRAAERAPEDDATALTRRFSRQHGGGADRDVQRLVRSLHGEIKTADKLLRKTADVWKISGETDLVDLIVQRRGDEPEPASYVLLKATEIRPLLRSLAEAARAAGEDEEVSGELERAAESIEARAGEYLQFGFAPWEG